MKREQGDRTESRAGVGVSSTLMILVVLAMAALSMLAFSQARTTESLTERNLEATQAYYQAAATLQRRLQEIDLAAWEQPEPCQDALAWYEGRGLENVEWLEDEGEISFTVTVEDGLHRLLVAQGTLQDGDGPRYRLTSHCLFSVPSDEPEYFNLMGE